MLATGELYGGEFDGYLAVGSVRWYRESLMGNRIHDVRAGMVVRQSESGYE